MGSTVMATLAWQEIYKGTLAETRTLVGSDLFEPRTSCFVSVGDQETGWVLNVIFEELNPLTRLPLKGGKRLSGVVTPSSPYLLLTIPFGAMGEYQVTLSPTFPEGKLSLGQVDAALRSEPVISTMDKDGKQIVVVNPATEGSKTRFVGAGGKPSDGSRTTIAHRFAGPETYEVDLQWPFPIEVNDVEAHWKPESAWDVEDTFHARFVFPATPVVPNGGGTGNCNVTNGVITPANGDGAYDVDLAAAVPVPSSTGFYSVEEKTGAVSVSSQPGSAPYLLVAAEVDSADDSTLIDMIDLGNPMGVFEVSPYKTEYVHPSWIIRVTVDKVTAGAGTFGGWIMGFKL